MELGDLVGDGVDAVTFAPLLVGVVPLVFGRRMEGSASLVSVRNFWIAALTGERDERWLAAPEECDLDGPG